MQAGEQWSRNIHIHIAADSEQITTNSVVHEMVTASSKMVSETEDNEGGGLALEGKRVGKRSRILDLSEPGKANTCSYDEGSGL